MHTRNAHREKDSLQSSEETWETEAQSVFGGRNFEGSFEGVFLPQFRNGQFGQRQGG